MHPTLETSSVFRFLLGGGLALALFAGCGGGSSGDATVTAYSCNDTAGPAPKCTEYVGTGYLNASTRASNKTSCENFGAAFSESVCPTASTIGNCQFTEPNVHAGVIYRYYSTNASLNTAVDAETHCETTNSGSFATN